MSKWVRHVDFAMSDAVSAVTNKRLRCAPSAARSLLQCGRL